MGVGQLGDISCRLVPFRTRSRTTKENRVKSRDPGMAFSCLKTEEEKEGERRSRQIDRQLKSLDKEKDWKREMKVLLLGAGESGKSTFLKQMRIIHGEDYSDSDRLEFRPLIYHNILKGMKVLVEACRRLQIPFSVADNDNKGDIVSSGYQHSQELSPEEFSPYVEPLKSLWKDTGIQTTLARSNEFQLVRTKTL